MSFLHSHYSPVILQLVSSCLWELELEFCFSSDLCQLVEETGVPGEDHRLTPSHWQLSHMPPVYGNIAADIPFESI